MQKGTLSLLFCRCLTQKANFSAKKVFLVSRPQGILIYSGEYQLS